MNSNQLTGEHFIGRRRSLVASPSFHGQDPATGNPLQPPYGDATSDEVHAAVELAEKAFFNYREISGARKAEFLESIADRILALGDTLVQRCCAETGLPEGRITGERGRTVNQLKMFARVVREGSWVEARIDKSDPERTPAPKPDVRSMAQALGPVGVFGASNFPLAFSVAGGDTASALAAGCPVVFKGHPAHPGTCELVAGAIIGAADATGMPDGVFSLVHGKTNDVGMTLVKHPAIRAIGFTGSLRGGKAIFDAAVRRDEPIPVYAEMGSINPVFVLPGVDGEQLEEFARSYVGSFTLGAGQFCTNPGVAIVLDVRGATDTLTGYLEQILPQTTPSTMLSKDIRHAYETGADRLAEQQNVIPVARSPAETDRNAAAAQIFRTTATEFLANTALHEEVFGPASLMVSARTADELIGIAGTLHGHLTASIFGTESDLLQYRALLDVLKQKVGRLIINGFPTGVEVCDAMVHGGPFPATTDSRTTSVGTLAIRRFARPVCFQGFPDDLLPAELRDSNPLRIWRMVNGETGKD